MSRLQPPKNVRLVEPRRCENCAHMKSDDDGYQYCVRSPDDTPWEISPNAESGIFDVVCDGHKRANTQ